MKAAKPGQRLYRKYPPSEPCGCDVCRAYCARPGWWTVEQAERAFTAGLGCRMMLEIAPDWSFGVLSPAFQGCEQRFALQTYAGNGCNFLADGLCELHDTELLPLECAYCHHLRKGLGSACHAELALDWRTPAGRYLVKRWCAQYLSQNSLFG